MLRILLDPCIPLDKFSVRSWKSCPHHSHYKIQVRSTFIAGLYDPVDSFPDIIHCPSGNKARYWLVLMKGIDPPHRSRPLRCEWFGQKPERIRPTKSLSRGHEIWAQELRVKRGAPSRRHSLQFSGSWTSTHLPRCPNQDRRRTIQARNVLSNLAALSCWIPKGMTAALLTSLITLFPTMTQPLEPAPQLHAISLGIVFSKNDSRVSTRISLCPKAFAVHMLSRPSWR